MYLKYLGYRRNGIVIKSMRKRFVGRVEHVGRNGMHRWLCKLKERGKLEEIGVDGKVVLK